MTNPFRVPGLEEDPTRPLCPWDEDTAEHEEYYVDVDTTAKSYADFTMHMSNPDRLLKNGRLVLVAGQEGCGKTSLINRCAHWLMTTVPALRSQLATRVIDLTKATSDNETVHERMAQTSRRLADEVRMRRLVEGEPLADIMTSRDRPNDLYPQLSGLLNERLILIVLLPPINLLVATEDVMVEMVNYNRLVGAKLVLFIEVTVAEGQTDRLSSVRAHGATPPIVLPVSQLRHEDGELFSTARLSRHQDTAVFPQMTNDAKEKIVDRPTRSVKSLQKLLYQVYEERRLSNSRYSQQDHVTYADITDYAYRHFGGQGL
jgi:hypothetical protein